MSCTASQTDAAQTDGRQSYCRLSAGLCARQTDKDDSMMPIADYCVQQYDRLKSNKRQNDICVKLIFSPAEWRTRQNVRCFNDHAMSSRDLIIFGFYGRQQWKSMLTTFSWDNNYELWSPSCSELAVWLWRTVHHDNILTALCRILTIMAAFLDWDTRPYRKSWLAKHWACHGRLVVRMQCVTPLNVHQIFSMTLCRGRSAADCDKFRGYYKGVLSGGEKNIWPRYFPCCRLESAKHFYAIKGYVTHI